jgi:hypothetical protein
MNDKSRQLTFAILDKEKGISELPSVSGEEFPLPAWYRSIREVPLEKLSLEDVCKACRQKIHLEYIIPLSLEILESEPLAGEIYEGELLVSLKSAPKEYWLKHTDQANSLSILIKKIVKSVTTPRDICEDAKELLERVKVHLPNWESGVTKNDTTGDIDD